MFLGRHSTFTSIDNHTYQLRQINQDKLNQVIIFNINTMVFLQFLQRYKYHTMHDVMSFTGLLHTTHKCITRHNKQRWVLTLSDHVVKYPLNTNH